MDSLPYSAVRDPPIAPTRKILCALAVAVGALLATAPGAPAAPPRPTRQRLVHAHLSQAGRELIFSVRTAIPVALDKLIAHPDTRRPASRYLCLALRRAGGRGETRLCFGGKQPRHAAGRVLVNAAGKPVR